MKGQTACYGWVVDLVAGGLGIEVYPVGSMTCKREDLQKAFEADAAYYVGRGPDLEDRDVDLAVDPPPDLIIEVEVTHPALPRFPIYEAFGVPEVWRYIRQNERVEFYRLESGGYVETASSVALT
jgi:Uma2 family endonuclease